MCEFEQYEVRIINGEHKGELGTVIKWIWEDHKATYITRLKDGSKVKIKSCDAKDTAPHNSYEEDLDENYSYLSNKKVK